MICGQTRVPGVSVSQVARRYDVNANLVFAWLRDPRFADADAADVARFLPVEIVAEVKAPVAMPAAVNHIEIELAGGHRMRISGEYDPEALVRLIRGLTA
ncbi:transposase [Phaeovulum veldkampii DSM 11550]|nr:transposase [Phaeovulum veldkampii DSM 11550]